MQDTDLHLKNLLFLLAAAPMATGCIITVSDDVADSDTGTTEDGETTETDDEVGTTDGTTSETDTDTTDETDTTDTTDETEETDTFDGTDSDTTGEDGVCADYANFYAGCYGEQYYQENLEYCTESLAYAAMASPECADAVEAVFACLSALTCEEYMQEGPCEEEELAAQAACA